jgi:hypothetical protein
MGAAIFAAIYLDELTYSIDMWTYLSVLSLPKGK